jgi:hypothetical protein
VTPPRFALVPVTALRPHEEIQEPLVERLLEDIRTAGTVVDPIWVESKHFVILNGHHRYEALRRLDVELVPVFVIEYDDPQMELHRWNSGPPLTKAEVVRRARARKLFPPKTSRHVWVGPDPPPHATPLSALRRAEVQPPG